MSLSREARGLVDAARREAGGPTQEQRKRMRRGVMAAVGASAVAGATATSSTAAAAIATPAAGIVAKVGIGALVVALVGGGVALFSRETAEPTPVATTASGVASPAPTVLATTQTVSTTPTAEASVSAVVSASATTVVRSSAAPVVGSATNGGLAEEVRLLTVARNAVASGSYAEGLVSLDQYAARFPKGQLGYEAGALRAIALCGAGRKSEGRALAAAIAESSPGSPVSQRVTEACK